jgi:hypothetical protein
MLILSWIWSDPYYPGLGSAKRPGEGNEDGPTRPNPLTESTLRAILDILMNRPATLIIID